MPRSWKDLAGSCKIFPSSCRVLRKTLQDFVRSCQDPARSYLRPCKILPKTLQDPAMIPQDLTKNPARSCQDPARSYQRPCKILPRSCKILYLGIIKFVIWEAVVFIFLFFLKNVIRHYHQRNGPLPFSHMKDVFMNGFCLIQHVQVNIKTCQAVVDVTIQIHYLKICCCFIFQGILKKRMKIENNPLARRKNQRKKGILS